MIDTCLLIDVAEADPTFGVASAKLLDSKRGDGFTICPVSYVELAPVFNGDQAAQNVSENPVWSSAFRRPGAETA